MAWSDWSFHKNGVIFINIIQDLIESKHVKFPNKKKWESMRTLFSLVNTLSVNMTIITNDILVS
jgi:hypothetical protein